MPGPLSFAEADEPAAPPKRTQESRQPLNDNIVDNGGTAVTIDPDIRYPGNGGGIDGGTP